MKILLVLLIAFVSNNPKEIAKINALKKEAEKAYLAGDYEMALSKYAILSDSMGVEEDEIKLNLAHSHYQLGDTTGAKSNYNQLVRSSNKKLKSIAYQQLGVMSKDTGKLEEALQQLKSAIKSDPTNQAARYDYEVVKKQLKEQQEQEQQNQDQDQENKDGEDENEQKNEEQKEGDEENEEQKEGESDEKSEEEKEQEQQEGEQKEGEEEEQEEKSQEQMTKEKLEEMNISEEKARMLLEAMRQNEIKYLQQQKRKATERPPSGKPDW